MHDLLRHKLAKVYAAVIAALLAGALWYHVVIPGALCGSKSPVKYTLHLPNDVIEAAEDGVYSNCSQAQRHVDPMLFHWPYLHPALNITQHRAETTGPIVDRGSNQVVDQPTTGHLITPNRADVAASRHALQQYLLSPEFAAQHAELKQQQQQRRRGILISAGGKGVRGGLTHLVVLLKVLREHLQCTLPVEVAWQGKEEMNSTTLAALKLYFAPLSGFDVTAKAYPQPLQRPGVSLTGYVGKVAALLHTSFHEVILLDADNLPVSNPEKHFADPLYQQAGNMFWSDYWKGWVNEGAVYPFLGLNREVVKPLLSAGATGTGHDAETGLVLLDRVRWFAVLHWIVWINTWHDPVYTYMLGDKDSFALGFALAGHADKYRQVFVPPGAGFTWAPGWLVCSNNPNCPPQDGWQLVGMLQYDNYGRPAYFHRTALKLAIGEKPAPVQIITGPLPYRWIRYYIAQDSEGPTRGKHSRHVAPSWAFDMMHVDPSPSITIPTATGSLQEVPLQVELSHQPATRPDHGRKTSVAAALHNSSSSSSSSNGATVASCPLLLFSQYAQLLKLALPVEPQPWLECACKQLLPWLSQAGSESAAWQQLEDSSMPADAADHEERQQALSAEYLHGMKQLDGRTVPDSSRVPALRLSSPFTSNELLLSGTVKAINESQAALEWLQSQAGKEAFGWLFI